MKTRKINTKKFGEVTLEGDEEGDIKFAEIMSADGKFIGIIDDYDNIDNITEKDIMDNDMTKSKYHSDGQIVCGMTRVSLNIK